MKEGKSKLTMLDYCKTILEKMSFNKTLFKKEYRKSFAYLNRTEQSELKAWLRDSRYPD